MNSSANSTLVQLVAELHCNVQSILYRSKLRLTASLNNYGSQITTHHITKCIAWYQFLVHCAPKLPCEDEWVIPSTLYHTQCLGWRVPLKKYSVPRVWKDSLSWQIWEKDPVNFMVLNMHTSSEGKLDTRRWTETWDFLWIHPAASFSRFLSLVSPSLAVDTKINYARHTWIRSFTRPRM